MCQTKEEGGRRCPGTPTGRALARLYRARKAAKTPNRAAEITARIDEIKQATEHYGGRFVSPFEITLAPGVQETLAALSEAGDPLVVGGAVRDAMVGAPGKDVDIEVHGVTLSRITSLLRGRGFQVDEVGKSFGVLKVSKQGVVSDLDVSVPRRENAVGAGHRDFEVTVDPDMTVTEAAARRDFTVNAVMYDPVRHLLVDPCGGQSDMAAKVLRHVSEKFAEDPLRVLRGAQFAGRFGLTMAPETVELCRSLRPAADTLPAERVAEEWGKLLGRSTDPVRGLDVLIETGWDDTLPGLPAAVRDPVARAALAQTPGFPLRATRVTFGAAAVVRAASDADRKSLAGAITVGNDQRDLVLALAETDPAELSDGYARRMAALRRQRSGWTLRRYRAFATLIGDEEGIRCASAGVDEGIGDRPEEDLVAGRDLVAMDGRKPGPWVGKLLTEARERQYRGEFSSRDEALAWVRRQLQS